MEKKEPIIGKSRAIPLRLNAENDSYVTRLKELRQYSSINHTLNRIIENHKMAFEIYRLKAKAKAEKLRAEAKSLMNDFDLQEKDMA